MRCRWFKKTILRITRVPEEEERQKRAENLF